VAVANESKPAAALALHPTTHLEQTVETNCCSPVAGVRRPLFRQGWRAELSPSAAALY